MFKNLLVPLDGSRRSELALATAKRLAEGTDARVTLFTVGDRPRATDQPRKGPRRPVPVAGTTGPVHGVLEPAPPVYAETPGQAIDRREHELLVYLEDAGHALRDANIRVTAAVHFGTPADEIVAFARRGGFDAIVMATHGRSGLLDAIHGSVTAAVIRSGVAPVLVVRPSADSQKGGSL